MKKLFLYSAFVLFLISCEKEIAIDLNSTTTRYVIEANVSTELNESKVKITQSLNFDQAIPFPTINNATVSIKDNTTNQEYGFLNSADGLYTNDAIQGIKGHAYTMMVMINDQQFTATSTIPKSVEIDSLKQVGIAEVPAFGSSKKSYAEIIPVYKDPVDQTNYYQFVVTKNGLPLGDIYVQSDFIFNGTVNTRGLRMEAQKDDLITVDIHCIELPIFDYLHGLNQVSPVSGDPPSGSPTNPISNINNNALGYFKAHTSSRKTIVVQ